MRQDHLPPGDPESKGTQTGRISDEQGRVYVTRVFCGGHPMLWEFLDENKKDGQPINCTEHDVRNQLRVILTWLWVQTLLDLPVDIDTPKDL